MEPKYLRQVLLEIKILSKSRSRRTRENKKSNDIFPAKPKNKNIYLEVQKISRKCSSN